MQTRAVLLLISTLGLFSGSVFPESAGAQSKTAGSVRYWLSGGMGVISGEQLTEIGTASFRRGSGLVSVRGTYNLDYRIFDLLTTDVPLTSTWDLGVLYGRITTHRFWQASASAGVGIMGGMRRGTLIRQDDSDSLFPLPLVVRYYEERPLGPTLSIPFEAHLSFTPLPFLGLGVYWIANVNRVDTFSGFGCAVQLGWVR